MFARDEWEPGNKAVFTKFEGYKPRSEPPSWAAGGKVAKVDRLEWVWIPDMQTAVNALINGEIDLIESPAHDLLPILDADDNNVLDDTNPLGNQYLFRMNWLHPPFDNQKVRQAALAALNQEDFLKAVIGDFHYYRTCPAMFVCDTPFASDVGGEVLLNSDFERSKQLLKEAGYDGTPVVLMHSTDLQVLANLAPVAKQLLEKGGFTVDMQSMDWQTLVSRRAKAAPPADGGWNAFLTFAVAADVLNPISTAVLNASCEDAWFGWPCDEQLEQLRLAFAKETDPVRQTELAQQIQVRALEVGTHAYLGQWYQPMAYRDTHTVLPPAARMERTLAIMRHVRLPEPELMAHAYPHQLSGGQRQRIMIAMALVLEPVLLIADEPTTALDVTTQAQILQLIKDIQREHDTAVLFITHDFGVVAEIADQVAVMQRGKVAEAGDVGQVLVRPRHPYTRMLIGSVPGLAPKQRASAAAPNVVLRTVDLTKVYCGGWFQRREVRAAEGVNLEVRRGETLGLVGESGSGKTTVARCIARLIDVTAGEIWLEADEISRIKARRLRPHRRRIQIVFQDPYRSLNPRRSVGASIVEGPMNYGLSRADAYRRARSLMALVNLDPDALGRYPHQFSGGQRQRICIARALAMEPELLRSF